MAQTSSGWLSSWRSTWLSYRAQLMRCSGKSQKSLQNAAPYDLPDVMAYFWSRAVGEREKREQSQDSISNLFSKSGGDQTTYIHPCASPFMFSIPLGVQQGSLHHTWSLYCRLKISVEPYFKNQCGFEELANRLSTIKGFSYCSSEEFEKHSATFRNLSSCF